MEPMTGKMPMTSLKPLLVFAILFFSTSIVQAGVNISYVHTDHLGTPQVMTDENQNVVWQADYPPFGEATVTTEAVTNSVRFPGQYYDEETGLHYNYLRDYDPTIGRYLEPDPIGLQGGLNIYNYVQQNPLNLIDPTGQGVIGTVICGVIQLASALSTYEAILLLNDELAIINNEIQALSKSCPIPSLEKRRLGRLKELQRKANAVLLKEEVEIAKEQNFVATTAIPCIGLIALPGF